MPKGEEMITKVQCAHLVFAAEKEVQKNALIFGAISGVAMFVSILSPIFAMALMAIAVAYAVFVWKKQGQKLNYLIQKYLGTPPQRGMM